MYKKLSNIFWGFVLIAAGALALAQNQGYLSNTQPAIWAAVFATISFISLDFYFVAGTQNWGMLFPAGVFGALAFLLATVANGINNSAMVAPLFVGIGAPFIVAYFLDRARNWWALIPAGVMVFLTFVLLAADNLGGEFIGSALFFILAATFVTVYISRRVRWAIIVAYVMFVLGFMPLLAISPRPELSGIVVMFAIAIPFFVVYFRAPEQKYWALIPAGVLGAAGLVAAIVLLPGIPRNGYDERIPNAIMALGVAATFAVVGLRHHKRWAVLFSLVALVAAAANFSTGNFEKYWPALLVLVGFYLLFNALRTKTA